MSGNNQNCTKLEEKASCSKITDFSQSEKMSKEHQNGLYGALIFPISAGHTQNKRIRLLHTKLWTEILQQIQCIIYRFGTNRVVSRNCIVWMGWQREINVRMSEVQVSRTVSRRIQKIMQIRYKSTRWRFHFMFHQVFWELIASVEKTMHSPSAHLRKFIFPNVTLSFHI